MHRRQFLFGAAFQAMLGTSNWSCAWAETAANTAHDTKIPDGYLTVAREQGIPPVVLFSVALQESELRFGARQSRKYLPWPWTLNVRGVGYRYPTRKAAEASLLSFLRNRTTLVDIGLMQVCWHYFGDRLLSPGLALEPYRNLRVGASILRDHFRDTQSWFTAIGRYHSPGDQERAREYAMSVMKRVARTLNA